MSEFDKGIKVGDLVVTYKRGFFRVEKVERRFYNQDDLDYGGYRNYDPPIKLGDERESVITCRYVANTDAFFSKKKSNNVFTDISIVHVTPVKQFMTGEIRRAEEALSRIREVARLLEV